MYTGYLYYYMIVCVLRSVFPMTIVLCVVGGGVKGHVSAECL